MKTATITDYDFATATLTKKIREIAAYLKMRKIIVLENHDAKGYVIKRHALKFLGTEAQTSPFIQVENRIKLQNPIF